jgi:hypothetical protein
VGGGGGRWGEVGGGGGRWGEVGGGGGRWGEVGGSGGSWGGSRVEGYRIRIHNGTRWSGGGQFESLALPSAF